MTEDKYSQWVHALQQASDDQTDDLKDIMSEAIDQLAEQNKAVLQQNLLNNPDYLERLAKATTPDAVREQQKQCFMEAGEVMIDSAQQSMRILTDTGSKVSQWVATTTAEQKNNDE